MHKIISGFAFCLFLYAGTAMTPLLAGQQDVSAIEQLKAAFEKESNYYLRAEMLAKTESAMAVSKRGEDTLALNNLIDKALNDGNAQVVIEAIRVIGTLKLESFIDRLDLLYNSVEKSPMAVSQITIRCMIVRTLAQMPSTQTQQIFGRIISNQTGTGISPDVLETISAIGETNNSSFISTLTILLNKMKAHKARLGTNLTNKNISTHDRFLLERQTSEFDGYVGKVSKTIDYLAKKGR
jgi:hypothetical protein